jgi:hypothetical protein
LQRPAAAVKVQVRRKVQDHDTRPDGAVGMEVAMWGMPLFTILITRKVVIHIQSAVVRSDVKWMATSEHSDTY